MSSGGGASLVNPWSVVMFRTLQTIEPREGLRAGGVRKVARPAIGTPGRPIRSHARRRRRDPRPALDRAVPPRRNHLRLHAALRRQRRARLRPGDDDGRRRGHDLVDAPPALVPRQPVPLEHRAAFVRLRWNGRSSSSTWPPERCASSSILPATRKEEPRRDSTPGEQPQWMLRAGPQMGICPTAVRTSATTRCASWRAASTSSRSGSKTSPGYRNRHAYSVSGAASLSKGSSEGSCCRQASASSPMSCVRRKRWS